MFRLLLCGFPLCGVIKQKFSIYLAMHSHPGMSNTAVLSDSPCLRLIRKNVSYNKHRAVKDVHIRTFELLW